ncbi:N-acetyltransferase [Actinomadura harenae]|uniref:N-acetyltransferase n=2 Tax=Actinomadura harenae TaxID=2483351 RepID=A0A3M2M8P6_9ACTN|nr:N-acetyltransferase [Actinomadura harenae]
MTWLPADFVHPTRVALPGGGYHLRPISGSDAPLDYPAVMGSRERLASFYGGWPRTDMTYEYNLADLERHAREIEAHESFNYALLDDAGTALLGCVYIDPPVRQGADAEISWWVVDGRVGTELEKTMAGFVPAWIAGAWSFERPCVIGHDVTWDEWRARPKLA